jgi:putative membrane protein
MKLSILSLFLCITTCLCAQNISKKDEKFAKCAAQNGVAEVKFSELAKTHATSQDVKIQGQQMVEDHSKANEELKSIASKKGITLPDSPTIKQEKAYRKIGLMSGAEFDKKFTHCMVKDHKHAICLFKRESKKGKDAELKTFASKTLPTLESHLQMWKETCKKLKK